MATIRTSPNRAVRVAYTAAGIALTAIGILNYFIPGAPSTILLILALFCFKRGNERFEHWLLNHKWFGSTLRDWDENGWVSKRVKIIAVVFMVPMVTFALFVIHLNWVKALVFAIGVYGVWFVLSRPTKPSPVDLSVESDPLAESA